VPRHLLVGHRPEQHDPPGKPGHPALANFVFQWSGAHQQQFPGVALQRQQCFEELPQALLVHQAGDHDICVGEVQAAAIGSGDPLILWDRTFWTLH